MKKKKRTPRKRKDGTPQRIWGKMGRPPAEINKKQFEDLLAISPTLMECCAVFQVDDVTLNTFCKKEYGTTFSEILPHFGAKGHISLRRKVWQMALEKENTKAIEMLSKKYLGMEVENNKPNIQDTLREMAANQLTKIEWVVKQETPKEGEKEPDYFDK